jgi:hypothetical protein
MADFDYLTRRLDRIADDALVEAQKAVMEIQADATRKGALGNSRVYLFYDEAIGKTLKSTLERLTSVAFSVCGETTEEAAKAVETSAFKFVDAATTWLERKFKTEGAAFGFSGPPIETLRATLLKMVDDGVDDFRHGMSGDTRLKKDPLVSVVSTITNSPNAIQQTALGDSNQLSIQQQAPALLNAVNELLKSPEAKSLNEVVPVV